MENLYIQETWTNETEGCNNGETGIYETFTNNKGELFKSLQKEHGRCIGKVYIDPLDGESKAIGWIFQKCQKYSDCNEFYLQNTWVTLHNKQPEKTIKYHYKEI